MERTLVVVLVVLILGPVVACQTAGAPSAAPPPNPEPAMAADPSNAAANPGVMSEPRGEPGVRPDLDEQGEAGMPGGTGRGGDSYGGPAGTGAGVSGGRGAGGIPPASPDVVNRERRDFRADALSRLARVEDRVRALEREGDGNGASPARLRELKSQHKSLQSQLGALDRISDEAWLIAKDSVDEDLVLLEQSVERLDVDEGHAAPPLPDDVGGPG